MPRDLKEPEGWRVSSLRRILLGGRGEIVCIVWRGCWWREGGWFTSLRRGIMGLIL